MKRIFKATGYNYDRMIINKVKYMSRTYNYKIYIFFNIAYTLHIFLHTYNFPLSVCYYFATNLLFFYSLLDID